MLLSTLYLFSRSSRYVLVVGDLSRMNLNGLMMHCEHILYQIRPGNVYENLESCIASYNT